MKNIKFLVLGIFFAIVLSKVQAISWFRFYEMFKFQAFHMYGVIGSAVIIGVILIQLFNRGVIKDFQGNPIKVKAKKKGFIRNFVGGSIFGLGWALIGACPGPIFVLIGHGIVSILIVLFAAITGAFIYGVLNKKLPS